LRELEDAFEIKIEDAVPSGGGIGVIRLAPVAAAVVDKDVELYRCISPPHIVVSAWSPIVCTYFQLVSLVHRRLS